MRHYMYQSILTTPHPYPYVNDGVSFCFISPMIKNGTYCTRGNVNYILNKELA